MRRFTPLSLLALSACASFSCKDRHEAVASAIPQSVIKPRASQQEAAAPASEHRENAPPAPAGAPYEVRPAVQVKHRVAVRQVLAVTAEPGVLLGPKQQLVKAFDCTSAGAPRPDMFGICVGFKSCEAVEPARAEVLAELACKGPELTLQLISKRAGLVFSVTNPEHPLAKRAMTPIELPAGTRPEILPFERRNLTNYVDL